MRNGHYFTVAWLIMAVVLTAAGCGSGEPSSQSTTAALKGPGSQQGQSSSDPTNPVAKHPKNSADPAHPVVAIETSLGTIKLKLDAENARLTVNNFLAYAEAGYYEQTIFHEVNKGYAVLGGAYTAELVKKKTHTPIFNEARNGLKNRRGTIAMARQPEVIDSATSQFFINLADNPELDHKDQTPQGYGYCVFGEVTEGMDVVERIGNLKVHDVQIQDGDQLQRAPVRTVSIESIRRIR